jgi:hypothetical protein
VNPAKYSEPGKNIGTRERLPQFSYKRFSKNFFLEKVGENAVGGK